MSKTANTTADEVFNESTTKDIISLSHLNIVVIILLACMVIFNAWNCDDSYHSFIMARNLALGNGFVYNHGERVLAATNPFFTILLALAYFCTKEMFYTSIAVQVAISVFSFGVIMKKFVKSKLQSVLVGIMFMCSVSFMSYATSGLENCMLFLLTGIFAAIIFSSEKYDFKRLLMLSFTFSIIAGTRMDSVLIFIPIIVYAFFFKRDTSFSKMFLAGIIGLLPFIGWEIFSLFYYGLLVPNTALIKLNTGIPKTWYFDRGFQYFYVTLANDALVVLVPIAISVVSFIKRNTNNALFAFGIILYQIYIVYIGGDFMMGRHYTVLYYLSVILLLNIMNENARQKYKEVVVLIVIGGIGIISYLTSEFIGNNLLHTLYNENHKFCKETTAQITDEKSFYYKFTGFIPNVMSSLGSDSLSDRLLFYKINDKIEEIRKSGYIGGAFNELHGVNVFYNNDIYLTDQFGLSDPLLSHLPAIVPEKDKFRVGHIKRAFPAGYKESVRKLNNEIQNESLHEFYDKIILITRGDLFDKKRLSAIIELNLGKYDYLICDYLKSSN
ncbi:hypothetical protein IJT10_00790 [bacterium]|nr:hypothetical protein [bacterium]